MPVSVALGGDPAYTYAATAPMPDNMDEYVLAGFLRRRPVKLVKCVTNDIYVPADCDFVIEGYVDPAEEKAVEGPFGDHTRPRSWGFPRRRTPVSRRLRSGYSWRRYAWPCNPKSAT